MIKAYISLFERVALGQATFRETLAWAVLGTCTLLAVTVLASLSASALAYVRDLL